MRSSRSSSRWHASGSTPARSDADWAAGRVRPGPDAHHPYQGCRDGLRASRYPDGSPQKPRSTAQVAVGYYVVVPQDRIGTDWRPSIEAAAGIATAAVGAGNAALMGLSAARIHNAVPRALGIAIVAGPGDRRDITLRDRDGVVHFVQRDTDTLDAELITTDLGHHARTDRPRPRPQTSSRTRRTRGPRRNRGTPPPLQR
jgi:hypothetical protein